MQKRKENLVLGVNPDLGEKPMNTESDNESVSYDFFHWNQDSSLHEREGEEVQKNCDAKVGSESEGEIIIPKASKQKYHFCLFCEKPQSRLCRHLINCHSQEKGMTNYLKASGKDKKNELSKLRNAGDYRHNLQVQKAGKGEFVAKRRKSKEIVNVENYVHCPACLGFFQKQDLYRHDCPDGKQGPRRNLLKKGRLLLPDPASASVMDDRVRAFWGDMRQDVILLAASKDDLINALVGTCLKVKGNEKHHFNETRNKARELGRLLIELRATSKLPNACLSDFLRPEQFQTVLMATKKVAGFNESDCTFMTPSLAKKLGHSLSSCADIIETKAIETKDDLLEKSAKQFLKLHRNKWRSEISAHADRTLHKKKKGNHKRVPLCRDVATLSKHLQDKIEAASEMLQRGDTSKVQKAWVSLAESTLAQVFMFNRRRQREVAILQIKDLEQETSHDPDIVKSLTSFEQQLCKKLRRIEVFGKRGRIVPILLTKAMSTSIDLLMKYRSEAGVSEHNEYVFASSHFLSEGYLRGSDALRKSVKETKLEHPELITGTNLRKQVATLSQVVNLRDNELDVLAQYMGHDIQVHREFYRMPSATLQLAKISKLLIALDKGTLPQNCSLGDIEVGETEYLSSDAGTDPVSEHNEYHICVSFFTLFVRMIFAWL